jgi:hypothetical protein
MKHWMGTPPTKCDLCGKVITSTFVDGKTKSGPWGILCPSCHKSAGIGLGTGLGQQYKKQDDSRWLKTKG